MNRNCFRLVVIAVLLIIATVNVNAQWFLGGAVGINVQSENKSGLTGGINGTPMLTFGATSIGFRIAPTGGYYFNEKFALGLSLSVGGNFSKERNETEYDGGRYYDIKSLKNSVNWGIYPLIRYSVFTYKKFSVQLEGFTGVGCTHTFSKNSNRLVEDTKYEYKYEYEKIYTTISIAVFNVRPIFCFKFNDHLQMEAGLRFLNVGYYIDILKGEVKSEGDTPPPYFYSPPLSQEYGDTQHNFDFGFNSGNIFSLSQLTIGVIYKF